MIFLPGHTAAMHSGKNPCNRSHRGLDGFHLKHQFLLSKQKWYVEDCQLLVVLFE
jgi:hypothetical protein